LFLCIVLLHCRLARIHQVCNFDCQWFIIIHN
jgi:hypothetical protein